MSFFELSRYFIIELDAATTFWFVHITPLAIPVEPDVDIRHAVGHAPGHMRNALLVAIEILENEGFDSFVKAIGGEAETKRFLGKFWHCDDIMPRYSRDIASEYCDDVYTYAQFARKMRSLI